MGRPRRLRGGSSTQTRGKCLDAKYSLEMVSKQATGRLQATQPLRPLPTRRTANRQGESAASHTKTASQPSCSFPDMLGCPVAFNKDRRKTYREVTNKELHKM